MRPQIPQNRHSRFNDIGDIAEGLQGIDKLKPVITGVRVGDEGELPVGPVKLTRIDNQAADGISHAPQ